MLSTGGRGKYANIEPVNPHRTCFPHVQSEILREFLIRGRENNTFNDFCVRKSGNPGIKQAILCVGQRGEESWPVTVRVRVRVITRNIYCLNIIL